MVKINESLLKDISKRCARPAVPRVRKGRVKRDITIQYIRNILEKNDRQLFSLPFNRSWTIRRYLRKVKVDFEGMAVCVNGREAKLRDKLTIGDEIVVCPKVAGGIAQIFTWAMAISNIAMLGYSIYSAVTAKKPSFNTSGSSLDSDSAANAWDGVHTTSVAGGPRPLVYGERISGGNVLNEHITTDGENSYLNTLMMVSMGEVDSITLRRINRNLATNYTGYTFYSRLGTLNQTVIPNFEDLHSVESIAVKLALGTAHVHTTVKTDVEAFEIRFRLPALWQQDENGNLSSYAVTYRVEYKLHTDTVYTSLGESTLSAKSTSEIYRIFRKDGLAAGQYDIRITKTAGDTDSDGYISADLWLHEIDEINTDDLIYPGQALAGIRSLSTDQIGTSAPDYEMLVRGIKVSVPQVMNGATEVGWDDYYWDPTADCFRLLSDGTVLTWDGVTYVKRYSANPIWCIYDLITNKVYGLGNHVETTDIDISYMLEMAKYCDERVPDGEGGYEKRFRLDIVIDSLQDALDLLLSLCSVCRGVPFLSDRGEIKIAIKRPSTPVQLFHMGNTVKDSFSETWKSLRDIHNIINVQYDDQDNNYEADTVGYEDDAALNAGDPPRSVNTRYYGKKLSYALRYGRDYLNNEKYHNNTVKLRTGFSGMLRQVGDLVDVAHDVPQFGFSGLVAKSFLYKGNYSSTISYIIDDAVTYSGLEYKALKASVGVDPTDTEYWEVISRTKVKLDRSVNIETGKSYAIRIDFADGTYLERNVTDAAGTYTEVTLDEALPATPGSSDRFDGYSFGEVDKIVKPYWVRKINRLRSGEVEFELEEYVEEIFDDSEIKIPDYNYSSLSTDIPDVTGVVLQEALVTKSDGTVADTIDVSWTLPVSTTYAVGRFLGVKIYISDNAGESWVYRGSTTGTSFSISGVAVGSTYRVAVVSYALQGQNNVEDSPYDDITLIGDAEYPPDVTNLQVDGQGNLTYFTGRDCKFTWAESSQYGAGDVPAGDSAGDASKATYFKDFQIEIIAGGKSVRTEFVTDNQYVYTREKNAADNGGTARPDFSIRVWQRNHYNKRSENYAELSVTNPAPKQVIGITHDFSGRDLAMSWAPVATCDSGDFRRYKIIVTGSGGSTIYYRDATSFTYAYDENVARNGGLGDRSLVVEICQEDWFGQLSPVTTIAAVNPAPAAPAVTLTSFFNLAMIKWEDVGDIDMKYYQIEKSATGAWAGEQEVVSRVTGRSALVDVLQADLQFRVCAVDTFGPGTYSTPQEADYTQLTEDDLGNACIIARHLTAGELITLSAQIKEGIIQNAHIADLDAGKITTGTLTASVGIGSGKIILDGSAEAIIFYDDDGYEYARAGKLS